VREQSVVAGLRVSAVVRPGERRSVGQAQHRSHHLLCIFDKKALGRWKEIEVAKPVMDQITRGGFLDETTTPAHDAQR
jgi:hypothetical protein